MHLFILYSFIYYALFHSSVTQDCVKYLLDFEKQRTEIFQDI